MTVEAKDSKGRTYHLPVDLKGFPKEELTIASDTATAYQDIGDAKGSRASPASSATAPTRR